MNFSPNRNGNSQNRGNRDGSRDGNYRRRRRRFRRDRQGGENTGYQGGGGNGGPSTVLDELDLTVPEDKTVVVGITGEPGAGKSLLARAFVGLGAEAIDVDALGHEVIDGPATQKKLVEAFGEDILGENGSIQRPVLAQKAFENAETVATLNKITHGQLSRKVKMTIKKLANFVVIDAALLHELGLDDLCTISVYVRAPREQRLQRILSRGWSEDDLDKREQAAGDTEERADRCDLIVENSGDAQLLETYAKTILCRELDIDPMAQFKKDEEEDEGEGEAPLNTDTLTPAVQQQMRPPEPEPVTANLDDYLKRTLVDLQEEGEKLEVRDVRYLDKYELITEILRRVAGGRQDSIIVSGYLEQHKDHNAYLRSPLNHYQASATDAFLNNQQLRRYGLKPGMHVVGKARAPRGNERCPQMLSITEIMGESVDNRSKWQRFEDLVPLHAEERLFMERSDKPNDFNLRIVDLVAPIGKGQRGLIVSQPKAGKTVYLQKIANAITTNNPEVSLMVLLIDERPEEVTDMARSVNGEVIASTFDQHSSRHVQIADLAINKAKRLVECGKDVVILLDSITRLARAYNAEAPSSGRIMSGGIESGALVKPKQFFGAARNIENGGSLTILATALVDTGSVMDTVIFEEFKGTGNMELVLDRRLANKGIYPALDVIQSGTRRDDLMISSEEMVRLQHLRRFLADRSPQDAIDFLKGQLKNYKSNVEYLMSIDPKRGNGFK